VPLYHVTFRVDGKLVRDPVGHNRKEAERALDAIRGDIARKQYRVLADIPFNTFADRWLASLTGRATTADAYGWTIAYAKTAFGSTKVRALGPADIRRFLDVIRKASTDRERTVSQATLAKHLRHLSACLGAAVSEGYASENAVKLLHKTARPKVAKSRPAYFTDAELARLWPELDVRPVYAHLCKLAVGTGLRFGELAGLRWGDVDLLNSELHVARTYTVGVGETPPKSGEPRTIDLTPQALGLLERWFKLTGDDGLVFENETGGYLDGAYVRRLLYAAMDRAGIPRVGERGRKRDFHSLRHSFARIALEHGAEITWVQKQLGHSSIVLTVDTYGSWARVAEKAQAEKLAGAFAL
jgi:integrase